MRPSGELGLTQGGVGNPESFMNRAGVVLVRWEGEDGEWRLVRRLP